MGRTPPDPLPPAAIRDLPVAVAQELRSRGCRVPNKDSINIIRGEFFKPGQVDWAALCSTKKSTSLLVFPDGSTEQIAVLQTTPKAFSKWSISVISQEQLKLSSSIGGWKGPQFTEIDHQVANSVKKLTHDSHVHKTFQKIARTLSTTYEPNARQPYFPVVYSHTRKALLTPRRFPDSFLPGQGTSHYGGTGLSATVKVLQHFDPNRC